MSTEVEPGRCRALLLSADHRLRPRKRGVALEKAITEAVIAELGERGYASMSFESVATRAGTGKSALYRRWSDKASMVSAAIAAALPDAETLPLVGDLRGDLIVYLETIAAGMHGPMGLGMRLLSFDIFRHAEFADMWHAQVVAPWQAVLECIITSAIERGEARAGAMAPNCVLAGPSVLCHRFMITGVAMDRADIESLVDDALLPMLCARVGGRVSP